MVFSRGVIGLISCFLPKVGCSTWQEVLVRQGMAPAAGFLGDAIIIKAHHAATPTWRISHAICKRVRIFTCNPFLEHQQRVLTLVNMRMQRTATLAWHLNVPLTQKLQKAIKF